MLCSSALDTERVHCVLTRIIKKQYQALQSSVYANHVVYLQQGRSAASDRLLFLQPRHTRETMLDGTVSTQDKSQVTKANQ
jgi:hypothetical protein